MAQTNHRRLAVAIVTAFIFDIFFNIVYHCHFAMDAYTNTAELWRDPVEMQSLMGYHYLGHLILVSIAGVIFSRGYENKGWPEGLRFGLLLGLVLASQTIVGFTYLPIPNFIMSIWLLGNLLEGVVIGLCLALAYTFKLNDAKPAKKAPAKKKK